MVVCYDDFAETFGASRKDLQWEEINTVLEHFSENFSERAVWKIADIGCGNGRLLRHIVQEPVYLEAFQKHHTHYFGADLSRKLLEQAENDHELSLAADLLEWKQMDMRDICNIFSLPIFDAFFFIASFHHLESYSERLKVLKSVMKILLPGGKIYMINWNLLSQNNSKYRDSKKCDYPDGSADFFIKIGAYNRFYHSFSLEEYEKLARDSGLIIDTIVFGEKNSIIICSL